jgi:hypothetical protein
MKKFASAVFGLGLAGLTLNAFALCVKADGALDDPSVPPGSVMKEMLPSCDAASTSGANSQLAAETGNDKSGSVASQPTGHPQGR